MFQTAQAQVETACLDYESKKELFKEDVISDYDLQTAKMHLLRLMPPWSRQKPERLTHATVCHIPKSRARHRELSARFHIRWAHWRARPSHNRLQQCRTTRICTFISPMSENQMRSLMSQYGTPAAMIEKMPAIRLQLNDGSIYGETGCIETISGVINPQTGTLSISECISQQ